MEKCICYASLRKVCMLVSNLLESGIKNSVFMRSQSYDMRNEDSCLYTKKCIDDSYVIPILYVDDMLIAGKKQGLVKFQT